MTIVQKIEVKFSTLQEREGAFRLMEEVQRLCENQSDCRKCPLYEKGCDKLRDGQYILSEFFEGLKEFIADNEVN